MTQRSVNNKRIQDREYAGATRKSAASAKPAKAAAGTVHVVATSGKDKRKQMAKGENLEGLTREEKKQRKKERRRQEDRIYAAADSLMQADESYKLYHKIWWVIMGIGIAGLVILWICSSIMGSDGAPAIVEMGCLIITYGCVIGGIIFDLVKVRPLRNQYQAMAESMSENKLNAVIEKAAAENDRKQAEKEARRNARRKKS